MPKRAKKAAARPSPGGPGGMAALRRAQEKLKAMGIKPWKAPEPARAKKAAPPPAAEPAPAPRPVARTSPARARASAKKAAPAKRRR